MKASDLQRPEESVFDPILELGYRDTAGPIQKRRGTKQFTNNELETFVFHQFPDGWLVRRVSGRTRQKYFGGEHMPVEKAVASVVNLIAGRAAPQKRAPKIQRWALANYGADISTPNGGYDKGSYRILKSLGEHGVSDFKDLTSTTLTLITDAIQNGYTIFGDAECNHLFRGSPPEIVGLISDACTAIADRDARKLRTLAGQLGSRLPDLAKLSRKILTPSVITAAIHHEFSRKPAAMIAYGAGLGLFDPSHFSSHVFDLLINMFVNPRYGVNPTDLIGVFAGAGVFDSESDANHGLARVLEDNKNVVLQSILQQVSKSHGQETVISTCVLIAKFVSWPELDTIINSLKHELERDKS